MQIFAHDLSSKIIFAHMNKQKLNLQLLVDNAPYKIVLYSKNNQPLVGSTDIAFDLEKSFSLDKNYVVLVDKSTFGHLGIDKIVLVDDTFFKKIKTVKKEILSLLLISYFIVAIIGYFLARLFIEPMQLRRISMDNFIKESTHELNTPISALLMSVDAKKSSKDKHDERIKISAKRLSDIYKDLTYLFLHEDTKINQKELLDLVHVSKDEVRHLEALAQKKKITITQKYEQSLFVHMDKESLVRLLTNLLSNAIKYNKIGGKIVIILKDNCLSIEDTGIGIARDKQKEIFKRFYRATHESGGFGLGLNIVDKICKDYKIKVNIDSTISKGTKFTLDFSQLI